MALFSVSAVSAQAPGIDTIQSSADFGFGIAADSLVSIFGVRFADKEYWKDTETLPLQLGNVKVQYCKEVTGCYPLPLIYAGPTQINFVAPPDPWGGGSITVQATRKTDLLIESPPVQIQLRNYWPAIFLTKNECSTDHRYTGYVQCDGTPGGRNLLQRGAILDLDGRLIDAKNPARVGQPLQMYLTGLGAFSRGLPVEKVTLVMTNLPKGFDYAAGDVLYIGQAPWLTGMNQINLSLPAGLFVDYFNGIPDAQPCGDYRYEITLDLQQGDSAASVGVVSIPVFIQSGDIPCKH